MTGCCLGEQLRYSSVPLRQRPDGCADEDIFPLPLLPYKKLPSKGSSRVSAKRSANVRVWVNLIIVCLNFLWSGAEACPSLFLPSAPQARIHANLRREVGSFLKRSLSSDKLGVDSIRKYLKEDEGAYNNFGHVLPVSSRAGLPGHASVVNTTAVLSDDFPELAAQCEDPSLLLLPRSQWPEVLPPPSVKVDETYGAVLNQAQSVDLHTELPKEELVHVGDHPLLMGFSMSPRT